MQNINYQFFGVRLLFIAIGQWPRYPLQAPPKNTGGRLSIAIGRSIAAV
jgi:hypothetical protein